MADSTGSHGRPGADLPQPPSCAQMTDSKVPNGRPGAELTDSGQNGPPVAKLTDSGPNGRPLNSVPNERMADSGPNSGIRLELAGALSYAILPPLIEIAGDYAAEFVCLYCLSEHLFPMRLQPAMLRSDIAVRIPNVGYCSRTCTTYVLCSLHSVLRFRCPNPDRTVRKITVDGVQYLRSQHARDCCQLTKTEHKDEIVVKTDETSLQPLKGSCEP